MRVKYISKFRGFSVNLSTSLRAGDRRKPLKCFISKAIFLNVKNIQVFVLRNQAAADEKWFHITFLIRPNFIRKLASNENVFVLVAEGAEYCFN